VIPGRSVVALRLVLAAVAGWLLAASPAGAEDYPSRTVTIVNPFARVS
jgi:hypothetical protein